MIDLKVGGPYMARLAVLRGALKCEVLGMRRSRRPTVYSLVKKEFGLRGSKRSVLDQFCVLYETKKRDYLEDPEHFEKWVHCHD